MRGSALVATVIVLLSLAVLWALDGPRRGLTAREADRVDGAPVWTGAGPTVPRRTGPGSRPATALQAAGPVLSPGYSQSARPGSAAVYSHVLTNTSAVSDVIAVDARSGLGWHVDFTVGRADGAAGQVTVALGAGLTTTLHLRVVVPLAAATRGGSDTTTITATSGLTVGLRSTAVDVTVVPSHVYLPRAVRESPPAAKLGVDFGFVTRYPEVLAQDFPLASAMGARWVRLWLHWGSVERTSGAYDWSAPDAQIAAARATGLEPLVVVYGAPEWASDLPCGPVRDVGALERFVTAAVSRYPWVQAWEFTNEPDGRQPHKWGPVIGCWAPYPAEYADQLRRFHDRVKAVNGYALVFHGGLAYDVWDKFDRQFLTNTLRSGAGPWFDGVSLHYYPINPADFPTMADKIAEVRGTMSRFGLVGKRVWVTETSMWTNAGSSLELQRDFVVKEQTRGFCGGADNLFWYAVRQEPSDPLLFRWLIARDHRPDQGYSTYEHYARQTSGMYCAGPFVAGTPGVEAYRFVSDGATTYILWTNGGTFPVSVPASIGATITDRDGLSTRTVSAVGRQVTFDLGPQPVFASTW